MTAKEDLQTENKSSLVTRAKLFATEKHRGQLRKGTEIPYITHPTKVVEILESVTDDEEVIAAGWLHDVPEDQDVSLAEIGRLFGSRVARMVGDVTEPDKSLPWTVRKFLAREHVFKMDEGSLLLKSADMLANTDDIANSFREKGESMFDAFNAKKDDQRSDKEELLAALTLRWPENPLLTRLTPAVQTLSKLLA